MTIIIGTLTIITGGYNKLGRSDNLVQLLITGHAQFGSGLLSSVRLITGLQNEIKAINFEENMSATDLYESLTRELQTTTEDVLIFTDIPGGTPFNQSVLIKMEQRDRKIEVIAGTNLPFLIEGIINKSQLIEDLIETVMTAGIQGISLYRNKNRKPTSEIFDEGI